MAVYRIESVEGVHAVQLDGTVVKLLKRGGLPIPVSRNGWNFDRCYTGDPGLNFVDLFSTDGASEAVHYYSKHMDYISNGLQGLENAERVRLIEICLDPIRALIDVITRYERQPIPILSDAFLNLSRNARADLVRVILPFIRSPLPARLLAEPETASFLKAQKRSGDAGISEIHANELLRGSALQMQIDSIQQGAITVPSPFDGVPLQSVKCILLANNGHTPVCAYRFEQHEYRMVFYLLCLDWDYQAKCLYVPRLHLILYADATCRRLVEHTLRASPDDAILHAMAAFADLVLPYLAREDGKLGICYCCKHIGHHLWNELTGLHAIIKASRREKIPEICIPGAQKTEMYGRLEGLFPEISDEANRTIESLRDYVEYLYVNGVCMLRPTGIRIMGDLRERIAALAETGPSQPVRSARYEAIKAAGYTIFLLGLRVENRTVVDLGAFCVEIVRYIKSQIGKIAVIVDGHNRPAGGAGEFESLGQVNDHVSGAIAALEQNVVETLCEAFSADQRVLIVSTLGAPVDASLFWCRHSQFFVCPWGAGLAKYRWACNATGLVVMGDYFSGHPESYLYDREEYLEDPTPSYRISRIAVSDVPEAPQVVKMPERGHVSFCVNREGLYGDLHNILEKVGLIEPGRQPEIHADPTDNQAPGSDLVELQAPSQG